MEFEIEVGQIYGSRDGNSIIQVTEINDTYIMFKSRINERERFQMMKSAFIDMYEQEQFRISSPVSYFDKYEWKRIQQTEEYKRTMAILYPE